MLIQTPRFLRFIAAAMFIAVLAVAGPSPSFAATGQFDCSKCYNACNVSTHALCSTNTNANNVICAGTNATSGCRKCGACASGFAAAANDATTCVAASNTVITLNKAGGTGTILGATGTTNASLTCTGQTCALPAVSGVTRANSALAANPYWCTQTNGGGTCYSGGTNVTLAANTTLYLRWTCNTNFGANDNACVSNRSITLNKAGGTGTIAGTGVGANTTTANATLTCVGNFCTLPTVSATDVTRANSAIAANPYWCTQAISGGTCYNAGSTQTFTAATTLHLRWVCNSGFGPNGSVNSCVAHRTITLNKAGGSGVITATGVATQTATANASLTCNGNDCTLPTITSSTNNMTRANSALGANPYWCTAANGGGTCHNGGATVTFTAATTLHFKWACNSGFDADGNNCVAIPTDTTITLNKAGGSGAITGTGVTAGNTGLIDATLTCSGTSCTLPTVSGLTRADSTLGAQPYWCTAANGGGTCYNGGSAQTFASNTTLHLKWVCDSGFEASGNTCVVPCNASATCPAGWSGTFNECTDNTNKTGCTRSCTPNNSVPNATATSCPAGTQAFATPTVCSTSCVATACDAGFDLVGGACVNNTPTCSTTAACPAGWNGTFNQCDDDIYKTGCTRPCTPNNPVSNAATTSCPVGVQIFELPDVCSTTCIATSCTTGTLTAGFCGNVVTNMLVTLNKAGGSGSLTIQPRGGGTIAANSATTNAVLTCYSWQCTLPSIVPLTRTNFSPIWGRYRDSTAFSGNHALGSTTASLPGAAPVDFRSVYGWWCTQTHGRGTCYRVDSPNGTNFNFMANTTLYAAWAPAGIGSLTGTVGVTANGTWQALTANNWSPAEVMIMNGWLHFPHDRYTCPNAFDGSIISLNSPATGLLMGFPQTDFRSCASAPVTLSECGTDAFRARYFTGVFAGTPTLSINGFSVNYMNQGGQTQNTGWAWGGGNLAPSPGHYFQGVWTTEPVCPPVGDGYWGPNSEHGRTQCPDGFRDGPGVVNQNACVKNCPNQPITNGTLVAVSSTVTFGASPNTCSFTAQCDTGYHAEGLTCVLSCNPNATCPAGWTGTFNECTDDTNKTGCTRACTPNNSVPNSATTNCPAGTNTFAAPDVCSTTCTAAICATNYYLNAGACNACDNAPTDATYTGGGTGPTSNCPWTCNSGFTQTVTGQCAQICAAGFSTLRIGNVVIPLYATKQTTPAIHVQSGTGICYGSLDTGTRTDAVNVDFNGALYNSIESFRGGASP
ncbi:MAG: hypothetical protein FWE52_00980 [Alphaproteobacteria bacterium]|nr:hypothetical protein [Alphaproteobacteria bacterium]